MHWSLLPWLLDRLGGDAWDVFHAGFGAMATRYEALGLDQLLPIDRVWVGVRSTRDGAFGGFHHPDQGYRHLQMGAVVTRYGDLYSPAIPSAGLVALDLLRAYAHDCLHYGSHREYGLQGGEVVRTQYGFNRRTTAGRSYSAPDPKGAATTRNLGVIMEGATDREAAAIARHAAHHLGIPIPDGTDQFAFLDATGQLTCETLSRLPRHGPGAGTPPTADRFLAAMGSYARSVNGRYRAFLGEIGERESDELHVQITTAMISGSVASLSAWLDIKRGPGAFAALFRAASYDGPEPDGAA
ncbi:hypothetical protein [Nonomuraea guangzhouensis]|uniref:Uncharacterized protein n=1 Tax=Nonomuraea guangzhouensis TaxID=1291555 RepID=A0ABW4GWM8_9ACTN|nr:hypothetical protein [Nonomuraea guangzhouensis]